MVSEYKKNLIENAYTRSICKRCKLWSYLEFLAFKLRRNTFQVDFLALSLFRFALASLDFGWKLLTAILFGNTVFLFLLSRTLKVFNIFVKNCRYERGFLAWMLHFKMDLKSKMLFYLIWIALPNYIFKRNIKCLSVHENYNFYYIGSPS